jgi:hypothetical protein
VEAAEAHAATAATESAAATALVFDDVLTLPAFAPIHTSLRLIAIGATLLRVASAAQEVSETPVRDRHDRRLAVPTG